MAVSKKGLAAHVADRMGITVTDARSAVNAVMNAMTDALKRGEDVCVQGFGTLKVTECAPRRGRDIQRGETIDIDAYRTVRFKIASSLRDAITDSWNEQP